MNDAILAARAQAIVASCKPASPASQTLLDRYASSVDLRRSPRVELRLLREVCRLVEELPLETVSVRAFELAGTEPRPTRFAAEMRRCAAGRLRRLLQASGELPSARELAGDTRVARLIAAAPAAGRATLRRWDETRSRQLNAFERSHEIRCLARLEEVIEEKGLLSDAALTQLWLRRLVRQVVDCGCPPVTRANDPNRCSHCGATAETNGTRPSPRGRKQLRLRLLAERYLTFRRAPVPTQEIA